MKLDTNSALRIIGLFPLTLLIGFSTIFMYISYTEYKQIEFLRNKIEGTKVLKGLSINLAKERGLSATYLGSKGAIARDTLAKQRINTDVAMKNFKKYYGTNPETKNIQKLYANLVKLQQMREKADLLDIATLTFSFLDTIVS